MKSNTNHFQHKHGYAFLFKNPFLLKELIRDFVNKEFYESIDFRGAIPILEKSYLTEDYKEFAEDLIWKVKIANQDCYLYILMEFQSKPDKWMPLRMMNYLSLFYLDLIQNEDLGKANQKLPPVLPIMLYNGSEAWNHSAQMKDLIQDHPFLSQFYPQFTYFPIIERNFSPKELAQIPTLVSTVFRIENMDPQNLESIYEQFEDIFAHEDIRAISTFTIWLRHLFYNKRLGEEAYVEAMNIQNSREVKSMLVDAIAELKESWRREALKEGMQKGISEGIEQGISQGREEGIYLAHIRDTQKMLELGLDWNTITTITGITPTELASWQQKNP